MAHPMEVSETESEVVEVLAVNELVNKGVAAQPVNMTSFLYLEIYLGKQQVATMRYTSAMCKRSITGADRIHEYGRIGLYPWNDKCLLQY